MDDQHFVQKMLEHSLAGQADFQIIGVASHGEEALDCVDRLHPHIVLIDVEMPGIDGLEVTQRLTQRSPQTRVLVLSIHDDEHYIRQALQAGAKGYLLKTTPAEELAHAIRFVHRGYLQLGPGLFERLEASGGMGPSLAMQPLAPSTALDLSSPEDPFRGDLPTVPAGWTDVTQDLVNTLPQVWSRGLIYALFLFLLGLIPWSYWTRIDEVVTTQGVLQPQGQTIRLDAPVEAKVINVLVQEGNQVEQGQALVELQSDQLETDLQQAQVTLTGQLNQLNQQELLKNQILSTISFQSQQNQAQLLEKQAQLTQAEQTLDSNRIRAPIQASEKFAQVEQAIAALESAKQKVRLLTDNYQAELQEVARYQRLWQQGAVSKVQLVEAQRRAHEVRNQKAAAEAEASLAQKRLLEQQRSYESVQIQLRSDQLQAQTRVQEQQGGQASLRSSGRLVVSQSQQQLKDVETRMTELQAQIAQTRSLIQGLRRQQQQRIIYAPTSGIIFQLPIQNPGAVVRPGQMVAQLAPASAKLIFRGALANKDTGFIRVGLPVQLKLDAYPTENFGFIPGQVHWIAPSSRVKGTETEESSPKLEQAFDVEITLAQDHIQTLDQVLPLKAGQSAQAEIVVRKRRIMDLFLDPFLKFKQGSGKL
ncbi:response regulator [Lyngbya confervoides]|uniref:Response regulator n=1 Tax=Lyngbya confervoides BDU141951 TaxID=1574623 RepID=A0ABD4T5T2_9CYAN|nr:response regulator [Lyngbya confervoides]MCM1983954.1 response regulator [Lyngbya confervoides BDU141951]